MKTIEIKESTSLAPFPCESCGGLMRLVGSEPHPVEDKVDLLTFDCTACGNCTSAASISRRWTADTALVPLSKRKRRTRGPALLVWARYFKG